jgi:hypothetical protein
MFKSPCVRCDELQESFTRTVRFIVDTNNLLNFFFLGGLETFTYS